MATVYLADRDQPYRKSVAHALRQRAFEVVEFESGADLYAQTLAREPDLIVMDTDLEEMDGFQVFVRLRRKRPGAPYPVLFVTTFEHARVASICRQQGAVGYVGKSRSLEQVVAAVESALTRYDPLAERKLPAALAWLQSRGKSGRLDVESKDGGGFVLLLKGKVLEARWTSPQSSLEGEAAVTLFAEGLSEARFRFAEGEDETGDVAPAVAATSLAAAPLAQGPSRPGGPVDAQAPTPQSPVTYAEWGGMFATSREQPRGVGDARSPDLRRTGRRALIGVAAGIALLITVGVALAALFPGSLPGPLAGILGNLGIAAGDRGDQTVPEPVSPLASGSKTSSSPPRDRSAVAAETGPSPTGVVAENPPRTEPAGTRAAPTPPAAAPRERTAAPLTRRETRTPTTPVDQAPALAERAEEQVAGVSPPAGGPEVDVTGEARTEVARGETPETSRLEPTQPPPAAPSGAVEARPSPAGAGGQRVPAGRARPAPPDLLQKPVLIHRGKEPYYPPELREQGVTGSVVLNIRVGSDGRPQQVEVHRSSGYEAFDQAAVAAVGTFLWEPGRDASGATETWVIQAVTFR